MDFAMLDEHVVSGLLKLWLRLLPEPIIPFELFPQFVEAEHAGMWQSAAGGSEAMLLLQHSLSMLDCRRYCIQESCIKTTTDQLGCATSPCGVLGQSLNIQRGRWRHNDRVHAQCADL
jgi:hypothetical protein